MSGRRRFLSGVKSRGGSIFPIHLVGSYYGKDNGEKARMLYEYCEQNKIYDEQYDASYYTFAEDEIVTLDAIDEMEGEQATFTITSVYRGYGMGTAWGLGISGSGSSIWYCLLTEYGKVETTYD